MRLAFSAAVVCVPGHGGGKDGGNGARRPLKG